MECAISDNSVTMMNTLIDRHEKLIRRYVNRRSGAKVLKKATVEDIYQDTVLAAVASAGDYVHYDDARFLCWIQTITRRVISRLLTQNQGQVFCNRIKGACSSGPGFGEDELQAPIRTPSSVAAFEEHTSFLRNAIKELPDLHREVIVYYKLRQMPLAKVAQRIGKCEGHTSRIAAEALRMLRSNMQVR
jgi:RNA polymerase sigma factor (sigma-70 family)